MMDWGWTRLVRTLPGRFGFLPEFRAGDLCSTVDEAGGFRVVKLLVVERDVFHVRLYGNHFAERPVAVDPELLSLGSLDDEACMGIGHLPLRATTFKKMKPQKVMWIEVREGELKGYSIWKGDRGGVW